MIMGRSLSRLRGAQYEVVLGSIMFHVRRRPADCQPRRRKKKSGSIRAGTGVGAPAGLLIETQPDGSVIDNGRSIRISGDIVEVGSANGVALQLYGPSIQPRHCVLAANEGVITVKPLHADAYTYVNGQRIHHMTILQHGCIIKFGRMSTFRFVDSAQENKLSRSLSQSQHFDSGSVYDRSPTSPIPDSNSGIISPLSQSAHSHLDMIQNTLDPSGINSTGGSDFQRAMSPILGSNKMGSQDNFGMSYNKNAMDPSDTLSGYMNNNNNNVKMDDESLIMSQHLANSKTDLLQDAQFSSPYNGINNIQNSSIKDQSNKTPTNPCKDNYETTFDLDGNVETKSICSAKSGGSGHENNRIPRGQEAILPAVLEFPEHTQQVFLQNVITRLDVNAPAFKLAPVYTLYLCARYRASTHYRPDLTPTERAQKLTALLHHIANLIQSSVQEKYSDPAVQAFWMANSSELLHFLKCDRHISAFTVQAQDILAHTVQNAFSNLVGCFHIELSQVLTPFLDEGSSETEAVGAVISALGSAMALLRRCRVNAALTIQLFSQLFHYINVWCFNKVVTSTYMWCAGWGSLISARLAPIGSWAERQGLEFAAECYLALIHQCAHLLQAPKNTPDDIASLTSACFKLNSLQLRCLLGGFTEELPGGGIRHLPPDLVDAAVKHAQGVADELHRADGREITLEESSSLPLSLLIPEDGFSADVVRGLPSGFAEFLVPLQRAGLCRLAPQPHSQGHWTVYMNGYGGGVSVKTAQQPVVQVIQLQKNSNGMGLSIVAAKGAGQNKLGIYIKSVVAGGAAAADQRLQAGDQLLAVDGHSLVGITQEQAAEHLVRTGPIVTLQVAKQGAVLHGLATLLRQPSPQTSRGLSENMDYSDNFTRGIFCRKRSDGCLHSSDDSLNDGIRYVPEYVTEFAQEHSVDYSDIEDNYNNNPDYSTNEYRIIPPTFSFTDYDEVHSSEMRSACQNLEFIRNNISHREQSVDSSNQSYDSDCSYPECMKRLDDTYTYYLNASKKEVVQDILNEKSPDCQSFVITKPMKASDVLHSSEIYRSSEEYDEIPFIDEEADSIVYENKNNSKVAPRKRDSIPIIKINNVDEEFDNNNLERKASSDIGINIDLGNLSISGCKSDNSKSERHSTEEIHNKSSEQKDFLGQSPSDQNFFSENFSDQKNNKDYYYNNHIKINIGEKEKSIVCDGKFNLKKNGAMKNKSNICINEINEYNILENGSNIELKNHYSEKENVSPKNYHKISNRCKYKISSGKNSNLSTVNASNSEKDNSDSPTQTTLGTGKVKALAKHFNSINLTYQSKSYKRNCQSSPDLSQSGVKAQSNLLKTGFMSSSLDTIQVSSKHEIIEDKEQSNKYSSEEQKKILMLLEDWSKHGSESKLDDSTIDKSVKSSSPKAPNRSSLVYRSNVVLKAKMNNKNKLMKSKATETKDATKSPLNKNFGSLEKLTGSLTPRNLEFVPCRSLSTPNINKNCKKPNVIEKTKLILPRKKFPQSYIVKKRKLHSNKSNCSSYNVVQSCPNLLLANRIIDQHEKRDVYISCPDFKSSFGNKHLDKPSYMKICRIKNKKDLLERPPTPRFAWIQYGPTMMINKKSLSYEDISPRRMSERDLPSKLEMEQNSAGGHFANTVKSSKSVPALHEHTKQHEVFNPGYSRTSSNNSIPAMVGLKTKINSAQPHQTQMSEQNSFYQNLSVYRNTGLSDRSSTLRNSQNNLQLHGSTAQAKMNMNLDNQGAISQQQSSMDRLSNNQRPQSAYYGNQMNPNQMQGSTGIRAAQSIKDLPLTTENYQMTYPRGNYPSMPNVNQGYAPILQNNINQMPNTYSTNSHNNMGRGSITPNQYSSQQMMNNTNQYPIQSPGGNQNPSHLNIQSQYGNQNSYNNPMANGNVGHNVGNNMTLRGQAKLAEMSEEVTRRQQRGQMSLHGDNLLSPGQQNRFQHGQDGFGSNGPLSPNMLMSPTKPQPPVAPKPQGLKRGVSGEITAQDIPEGPPLPPTATHPLYHQQQTDEDGGYLASASDPPAVSFYPTQRPGQNQQSHIPPNPWEREEREKELEARRIAARVWRDQQIGALQSIGEEHRTSQQEQQLRALTLERDFQRRAQEAQVEDEDKDAAEVRSSGTTPHSGLLRLVNSHSGNPPQDLNLVPVASNIVSSIQPISVATSNVNGNEQQQDNVPNQQDNRMSNQPPALPSIQPKSILKSNLRLENPNSNSPQSPNKSQKNASFSTNLTPQSLKFDSVSKYDSTPQQKYDISVNSKYDHNINNKFDANVASKYDNSQLKYPDQIIGNVQTKYEQQFSYNMNNNSTLSKFEPNLANSNITSPNQITQAMGDLYVNSSATYNRMDSANSNNRYDMQYYNQENPAQNNSAPPPPERGSSFAIMSQQHALRSNLSTSSQMSSHNQNLTNSNNTLGMKDKRVSFHDNDSGSVSVVNANLEKLESDMDTIREDPDRFILEAENMLQSPTSPTGSNITHTPGVIGAQEVYRDPRQKRLAEQQKAQQAGNTPIPEKLSFKEKMKMFALESGESNTPKDKVKISRAQRDIDAVH